MLESENIELLVLRDEKCRRGAMPLVVLRRLRPPSQYYLSVNEAPSEGH